MKAVVLVPVCLLLLCSCAAGSAGDVWGVAFGQSAICSDHLDSDGKIERRDCIRGGAVSDGAAEQLGPLTRIAGAVLGIF